MHPVVLSKTKKVAVASKPVALKAKSWTRKTRKASEAANKKDNRVTAEGTVNF